MVGVIKLVLCGIGGVLCGFATCSCDINFKNFKVVYFMIEMLVLVVVVKETEMVGDIYIHGNGFFTMRWWVIIVIYSGPGCSAGWPRHLWMVAR